MNHMNTTTGAIFVRSRAMLGVQQQFWRDLYTVARDLVDVHQGTKRTLFMSPHSRYRTLLNFAYVTNMLNMKFQSTKEAPERDIQMNELSLRMANQVKPFCYQVKEVIMRRFLGTDVEFL